MATFTEHLKALKMEQPDLFQQHRTAPKVEEILKVHEREGNPESQKHLDQNKIKFTKQLLVVFDALMGGEVIELSWGYQQKPVIADVGRRLRNLLASGIQITQEWVKSESINSHKKWYMTKENKEFNTIKFGKEL